MKTILFFTPTLSLGGVEKVLITYANGLVQRYVVKYACSDFVENTLMGGLSPEVEHISLGNNRVRCLLFPLVGVLKKYKPDYLVTGGDVANAIAIVAGFISHTKVKVIISQHNYFDVESNQYSPKAIIKLFYNKAFKIVAVSNGIKDFLVCQGVDRNKISTIYNPIDLDKVEKLSNVSIHYRLPHRYLVSVGRLDKVKNVSLMIASFSIVKRFHKDIKLLIVGDGSEMILLKELCKKLNVEDEIVFTGGVSNPYPYIKNATLVLSSSLSEAMPTVFIEAFSLGKTMVSTPTRGAIELLEGNDIGYISKNVDDEREYASLIELALKNPCDETKIRDFAKNFSILNQVKTLESLFQ